MHVAVIGAGVIGLTAARALLQAGHGVTVVTADDPMATTSAAAAASCKPRLVPDDRRTRALLTASLDAIDSDAALRHALAVAPLRHVEAAAEAMPSPWYLDWFPGAIVLAPDAPELPVGTTAGVAYATVLFDVPVALRRLVATVEHEGRIVRARITTLDASDDPVLSRIRPDVVVNAAGMGALDLTADTGLVAVRGDVVVVAGPGLGGAASFSADGSYAYPRGDVVIVGGTAVHGDVDRTPRPRVVADILERAAGFVPELGRRRVMGVAVGTRPWRPAGVRCEVATDGAVPVVHAYGHGGAGWTLAPATAAWVAHVATSLASGAPPARPEDLWG